MNPSRDPQTLVPVRLLRALRSDKGTFVAGAELKVPAIQAAEMLRAGDAVLVSVSDLFTVRWALAKSGE